MSRSMVVAAVCAVFVLFLVVPVVNAFEVPCEIVIAPDGDPTNNFEQVTFNHGPHADLTCTSCHHMFEGYGEITACRECHSERGDREDTMGYYWAWHGKDVTGSCLGCHKALAEEGNEVVPVRCSGGCHES